MTNTKHTPGPWVYESEGKNNHLGKFCTEAGELICDFGHDIPYEGVPGNPPDFANAHLIAAAPDLLEALGEAVSAIEWWQHEHGCCHGATDDELNAARAAIAKAKGEAE